MKKYRISKVVSRIISYNGCRLNSDFLFFEEVEPEYYDLGETYLLSGTKDTKIWDPISELNLGVNNINDIRIEHKPGEVIDHDRDAYFTFYQNQIGYEFVDGTDEPYTTVEDLAYAGRRLGYNVLVLRDVVSGVVPHPHKGYHRILYVVYNPKYLRKIAITKKGKKRS